MIGPSNQKSNSLTRNAAIAYYVPSQNEGDSEKHGASTNDNIEYSIRAKEENKDQNLALHLKFDFV
eukprot:CAMPEP_0171332170 /NCGR_PEP_ID=MMETSP0878-20121228/3197_1 /TAXON_ID=67004 /ORGANISM="Thalassiosira weissflogii, Strain CCMP1336" /LENGTH=65 /DNA_ID=CAMNT_0011832869 /DNA_START=170 /DNA_END=367 /DNA_ORIENTATION=-